jgi:hypothetical protein
MVWSLMVTFSTQVTLGTGAFQVTPKAGGPAVPLAVSTTVTGGVTVATLTFPAGTGGSLADGNWVLRTVAAQVRDAAGTAMTADRTDAFYRLFGDSDGDRDVDGADRNRLNTTFGKTSADPGFLAYFDWDRDGDVDDRDRRQFRQRRGTTLAP